MVKKNMIVEVSFPGIEKKSAPVRSLANFIAENSSLYFRKDSGSTDEILPIDSFVRGKPNENYDGLILKLSSSDVIADTPVLVSGVLTLDSDPSHTLNVFETSYIQMEYPADLPAITVVEILVQSASKVNDVKGDIWNGAENLKVTILSDYSSGKDDLLALADRNNIQIYEFNYEPQFEDGNLWKITLTNESTANKKVYVSGIIVIPPPVDTHENATIIPIISRSMLVDEDHSFYIPQTLSIESLVISEQPLVEVSTDDKSNISGNIRFDNIIMPYRSDETNGFYDISALYGKSTAGNKVAAQSEEDDDIRGFKMVASKPGADGNRLTAFFVRGSGSNLTFTLYKDYGKESQEELFSYYIVNNYSSNNDYYDLNDMYDYADDKRRSVNEYIKFIYTSPFEYDDMLCKWGVFNYDDGKVVHFTGGSDSAESNVDTTITETTDSATGFVIDCETYLCKTSSTLAVRKWSFASENTCDVNEIDSFFKLPITITPKINGKVNTDKSVTPSDSLFSNITGACAIPLSGKVGKCDIQLRTPTFTLCEYDTESEEFVSDHDVYYKVGVVPFDGLEETRDKIVKILSGQCIELDYGIPLAGPNPFSLSIILFHADWKDNSYSILPPRDDSIDEDTIWCHLLDLENYINAPIDYTNLSEWMPKSMCLTLFDNSTLELKGLAYFKLCNNNGTPFDVELQKPYYVCLKQSEDEIVQPYDSSIEMYMTFTDEKLDGGFVRACNMNFGTYEEPGI